MGIKQPRSVHFKIPTSGQKLIPNISENVKAQTKWLCNIAHLKQEKGINCLKKWKLQVFMTFYGTATILMNIKFTGTFKY